MKIKTTLALILFTINYCWSQAVPQGINYQASARDTSGQILSNQNLSVLIKIRQSSSVGPVIYGETHSVTTSKYGIFNIIIGHGVPQSFILFSDIDWSIADYFVETSINGVSIGSTQMLSVPYSLYSQESYSSKISDSLNGFNPNDIHSSTSDFSSVSSISDSLNGFNTHSLLQPIIIGKINSNGTIAAGTNNFTCIKNSTGDYTISFSNPNNKILIPVGSVTNSSVENLSFLTNQNSIDVHIYNHFIEGFSDGEFSFMIYEF